jgi:hypothetical protein
MKHPTLTDVTRRAYDAGDFYALSNSATILLQSGFIRIWNDRKRPRWFQCRQDQLTGSARLAPGTFKRAREELVSKSLIDWEPGERNSRSASYSLSSWFYNSDHETDHETDHAEGSESVDESDYEPAPLYRSRERGREEETPIVPKGTKWEPDDLQERINSWFRRKDTTKWSDKEIRAFRKISKDPEEIDLLESYYTATIEKREDYRRRNIETLLNNWNGEVDKARQFVEPRKSNGPRKF